MNLSHNIFRTKGFPSGAMILAALGVFLFSGCFVNFSAYGGYQHSRKVGQMFENLNLPADYAYYYAHTFTQPEALIGIAPGYTLNNNLWHRVSPSQLGRLTDNMSVRAGYSPLFFGSYIKSPQGKIVGIYFSQFQGGPVKMESDNRVVVDLPNRHIRPPRLPAFG